MFTQPSNGRERRRKSLDSTQKTGGYILSCENISKSFGGTQALKGVELHVKPGEVHALLGENGAGKSTLMKIVIGLYRQDHGPMTFDGKPYQAHGPVDAINSGISMIQLVDYNIRVNSISPGYVATPMSVDPDFVEPELLAAWEPLFPMHRMAKPEELTGAIIWLASDASHYANGTDILIDGLYTAV